MSSFIFTNGLEKKMGSQVFLRSSRVCFSVIMIMLFSFIGSTLYAQTTVGAVTFNSNGNSAVSVAVGASFPMTATFTVDAAHYSSGSNPVAHWLLNGVPFGGPGIQYLGGSNQSIGGNIQRTETFNATALLQGGAWCSGPGTYILEYVIRVDAGTANDREIHSNPLTITVGASQVTNPSTTATTAPTITNISPNIGTFGSVVTISGDNLASVNHVSIGGIAVQNFRVENGVIIAIIGSVTTGPVIVSSALGNATGPIFNFIIPEAPVFSSNITLPALMTGDDNVVMFLPGRNIPAYASVSVMPISPTTNKPIGYALPVQVISVSETGATLLVPIAARIAGVKRLSLTVGDFFYSTTFAVVNTVPPIIETMSVSSTSSSTITIMVTGSGFFRNGFARTFVNGEENFYSTVIDARHTRIVVQKSQIRGGFARVLITNYDGQTTEATIQVNVSSTPFISSVDAHWSNGNLSFIIRGSSFSTNPFVVLGVHNLSVLRASDTEIEVAVPTSIPRPSKGRTILLMVENLEGRRYGYLLGSDVFEPATETTTFHKNPQNLTNSEALNSVTSIITADHANEMFLSVFSYPNPVVSDMELIVRLPRDEYVRVTLVDNLGHMMAVIAETMLRAGENRLQYNLSTIPSGSYSCLVKTMSGTITSRIMVTR